MHECALAAVIAAHPDLVQPLTVPPALVADARRPHESCVAFLHLVERGNAVSQSLIWRLLMRFRIRSLTARLSRRKLFQWRPQTFNAFKIHSRIG